MITSYSIEKGIALTTKFSALLRTRTDLLCDRIDSFMNEMNTSTKTTSKIDDVTSSNAFPADELNYNIVDK